MVMVALEDVRGMHLPCASSMDVLGDNGSTDSSTTTAAASELDGGSDCGGLTGRRRASMAAASLVDGGCKQARWLDMSELPKGVGHSRPPWPRNPGLVLVTLVLDGGKEALILVPESSISQPSCSTRRQCA
jgi:hypothetical protein